GPIARLRAPRAGRARAVGAARAGGGPRAARGAPSAAATEGSANVAAVLTAQNVRTCFDIT
ncbi:MAG: hypothetical protein ACK5ZZ_08440, partial [Gemmatimonadaceae bacterium]